MNFLSGSCVVTNVLSITQGGKKSGVCTSWFLEEADWMNLPQDGTQAGKIICPTKKCGEKLGSWFHYGV